MKFCNRPGTAQNKTSCQAVCGYNAAEGAMPLHIMLSSAAMDSENYTVNAAWTLSLSWVKGIFGHGEENIFPASVTLNEEGRSDGQVLQHLLLYYLRSLYPDVADIPGK
jgi:hypothetical protein